MTGVDPVADADSTVTREGAPAEGPAGPELVIANEFATVTVRRVQTRNGMRLEIEVPSSGRSVRLDPLVLESLTWSDALTLGRALETPFGPEGGTALGEHDAAPDDSNPDDDDSGDRP